MKPSRTTSRILEILAMMLIGDGALTTMRTRSHVTLWRGGARGSWWNRMITWCVQHRNGVRAIAAVEIVTGLALARSQWRLQRV